MNRELEEAIGESAIVDPEILKQNLFKAHRIADETKAMLMGMPSPATGWPETGLQSDRAMWEFIMRKVKFNMPNTDLNIRMFYDSLWPHIQALLDDYAHLRLKTEELIEDQDLVLSQYADKFQEAGLLREFLKKNKMEAVANQYLLIRGKQIDLGEAKAIAENVAKKKLRADKDAKKKLEEA